MLERNNYWVHRIIVECLLLYRFGAELQGLYFFIKILYHTLFIGLDSTIVQLSYSLLFNLLRPDIKSVFRDGLFSRHIFNMT